MVLDVDEQEVVEDVDEEEVVDDKVPSEEVERLDAAVACAEVCLVEPKIAQMK